MGGVAFPRKSGEHARTEHLGTDRLAELLAAISLATDLGRGFPQEKALRTCLIAQWIAAELGLDAAPRSDLFQVPEAELAAIRAQPTWQARLGAVHTITREIRAVLAHTFDPEQAARITVPVLVLTGADSPEDVKDDPEAVAAALPDARVVVIEGQQHLADVLVPDVFAAHVLAFLRS